MREGAEKFSLTPPPPWVELERKFRDNVGASWCGWNVVREVRMRTVIYFESRTKFTGKMFR